MIGGRILLLKVFLSNKDLELMLEIFTQAQHKVKDTKTTVDLFLLLRLLANIEKNNSLKQNKLLRTSLILLNQTRTQRTWEDKFHFLKLVEYEILTTESLWGTTIHIG
jgi:hypothetical protein